MLLRRIGSTILLILGLAACSSPEPPPQFPDIRFAQGATIRLDVSDIDIVSTFEPTFQAPQVEQHFPVPPQRAIENWVHDRLHADNPGSPLRARITIIDASAREAEGGARYDARASARVDIIDEHGLALRTAHAEATRTRSIEPDASADERDLLWYAMTRELVGSLTAELEKQIRTNFYPYVL
jgi:hypothetical protein